MKPTPGPNGHGAVVTMDDSRAGDGVRENEVGELGSIGHAAVSVGIGATFWAATGEPMAVPVAIGAGVLNDTDHLLDYYLWYIKKDHRKLYLLLHAWEYCAAAAIFALVAGNHPAVLAAAAANTGHLLGDYIAHKPKSPLTYSLLYRAVVRFERVRLVGGGSPPPLTVALDRDVPLWSHIASRLPSRWLQYLGLEQ